MRFGQFAERIAVSARGLTAAQTEALLEATAKREKTRILGEQTARAGIAPTTETIVDRVRGAPIEAATAKSTIIIEFEYLREIALWIMETLRAKAVSRSGNYQSKFDLMVNGRPFDVMAIAHETREIVIVNTAPYARRLEIGKTKDGSPFIIAVSKYEFTKKIAAQAQARFGNFARVRHTYVAIENPYKLVRAQGKRRDRQSGAEMLYPAIRVSKL